MKRKGLSEWNPSERALYTKSHILIVSQLKLQHSSRKKKWAFFESWRENSVRACYRNIVLASINSQKWHEYIKLVTMSIRSFVAPFEESQTPDSGIRDSQDFGFHKQTESFRSFEFACGIRTPGLWNLECSFRNLESHLRFEWGIHWERSGIQHLQSGIHCIKSRIESNIAWIPLHDRRQTLCHWTKHIVLSIK